MRVAPAINASRFISEEFQGEAVACVEFRGENEARAFAGRFSARVLSVRTTFCGKLNALLISRRSPRNRPLA
jgi:hypothetical protein